MGRDKDEDCMNDGMELRMKGGGFSWMYSTPLLYSSRVYTNRYTHTHSLTHSLIYTHTHTH